MTAKKQGARSKKPAAGEKRLTVEEFTFLAIEKLRKPGKDGLHVVFSGLTTAFRAYFPGLDPRKEMTKLANLGKITIRPAKGGAVIYKGRAPEQDRSGAEETLKKMGL